MESASRTRFKAIGKTQHESSLKRDVMLTNGLKKTEGQRLKRCINGAIRVLSGILNYIFFSTILIYEPVITSHLPWVILGDAVVLLGERTCGHVS